MDKKLFYSQLKTLAVPIALQTFMTAAISAGDSAMLGFDAKHGKSKEECDDLPCTRLSLDIWVVMLLQQILLQVL